MIAERVGLPEDHPEIIETTSRLMDHIDLEVHAILDGQRQLALQRRHPSNFVSVSTSVGKV